MKTCQVVELGVIGYGEAVTLQQRLSAARKAATVPDVLLLCEHRHVVTLGRNGKLEHLRASHEALRQMGVEFHQTNRGGDITYHGPGQLVGYPILHLGEIRRDVSWYVRQLEETMIQASAALGVTAWRVPGCTGVWTRPSVNVSEVDQGREKLGAIGVHLSRWVTSHGFAFNVSTDLRYFDLIVPCGIPDCRTTSLEKLLGRSVAPSDVAAEIIAGFGKALELEMVRTSRDEMDDWLSAAPEPAGATVWLTETR